MTPGAGPSSSQRLATRLATRLPTRLPLRLALAAVLVVTAWVLWFGWSVLRTDLPTAGTRKLVALWAAGSLQPPTPAAWQAAHRRLDVAAQRLPSDPALHESLGALWLVAGRLPPDDDTRAQPFARAVSAYEQTVQLRPTDAQAWAALALARQAQGLPMNEVAMAWDRARQLGPHDGHVQPVLLEVALTGWASAPPAMQTWVTDLYESGSRAQRRTINRMGAQHGLQFVSDTESGASAPASGASAARPAP